MSTEKKQFTFRDLKEALNKLAEEQLSNKAVLYREEEGVRIGGLDFQPEDHYVYKHDAEDCGTLELLKEEHGDDFNVDDYYFFPKGTPFLFENF